MSSNLKRSFSQASQSLPIDRFNNFGVCSQGQGNTSTNGFVVSQQFGYSSQSFMVSQMQCTPSERADNGNGSFATSQQQGGEDNFVSMSPPSAPDPKRRRTLRRIDDDSYEADTTPVSEVKSRCGLKMGNMSLDDDGESSFAAAQTPRANADSSILAAGDCEQQCTSSQCPNVDFSFDGDSEDNFGIRTRPMNSGCLMNSNSSNSQTMEPPSSMSLAQSQFKVPTARRPAAIHGQSNTSPSLRKATKLRRPPDHPFLEHVFGNHPGTRPRQSIIVPRGCKASRYSEMFDEISVLGKGSFGSVVCVRSRIDGWLYAVKKIAFQGREPSIDARTEIQALSATSGCQNVVQYHGAWHEDNQTFIQLELCKQTLSSLYPVVKGVKPNSQKHRPSPPTIRRILRHGLKALKWIHRLGLVHMDIKPDNMFLAFSGGFKIGDLGLATEIGKPRRLDGDSRFLAPEMLAQGSQITDASKADVYSLSLTVFCIAIGIDMPQDSDLWNQLRSTSLPGPFGWGCIPEDLRPVLSMMSNPQACRRPSAAEALRFRVLRHPGQLPSQIGSSGLGSQAWSGSEESAADTCPDDEGSNDCNTPLHSMTQTQQEEPNFPAISQSLRTTSDGFDVARANSSPCRQGQALMANTPMSKLSGSETPSSASAPTPPTAAMPQCTLAAVLAKTKPKAPSRLRAMKQVQGQSSIQKFLG